MHFLTFFSSKRKFEISLFFSSKFYYNISIIIIIYYYKDIRTVIQFADRTLVGLILNVPATHYYFWKSYHWIAVKPIHMKDDEGEDSDYDDVGKAESVVVYNLDSKLRKPEEFPSEEEVIRKKKAKREYCKF